MKKQINKYNYLCKYPIKIWQTFACVQTSPISFVAGNNVLEKKKHFLVNLKYPFFKYILFILKLLYLTLTYDLRIKGARKCLGYTRKGWAKYELTDALNKTTKH